MVVTKDDKKIRQLTVETTEVHAVREELRERKFKPRLTRKDKQE